MTKDMSEEKECKHGNLKWEECCSCEIEELEQENKSLESRLKEAEHTLAIVRGCDMDNVNMINDLRNKLSQAEAELKKCGKENCMGYEVEGVRSWVSKEAFQALEARLSQAEKEIKVGDETRQEDLKEMDELRERLFHLMDVAGKMAGALRDIAADEHNAEDCLHAKRAKLALAEYRSIK